METILQALRRIESNIYNVPYDDLTSYLQGVRDVINLVNGEENAESVTNHIIEQLDNLKNEIPF